MLISQHSSFERDDYIRYQSSLSSANITCSLLQHQDSGIGKSSSSSGGLGPDKIERDCVIPDSQPLPGSSSYVPTASTSTGIGSLNQPKTGSCVVSTSSYDISPDFSPSDRSPCHSPIQESSDPIEDSTDLPPGKSQDLDGHSSRSRSLPSAAFTISLKISHTRPGKVSRSTTDPSPIAHCERAYTDPTSRRSTEPVVSSAITEAIPSSDIVTQTQASLESLGDIKTSSGIEIDETLSPQSTQSQTLSIQGPEADRGAQARANVASNSQATHTDSAASAGKWSASGHPQVLQNCYAKSALTTV